MTRKRLALPRLCTVFAFILACAIQTAAQSPNVVPRITQPIDESNLVVLRGNTSPLARPEFDQGAAPASLPMQRMLLVLQRSPQQETALDQLLEQQQDNSSPNYHRWLTPQQFGADFGPAAADVQTITSWLQSHGFQVTRVSNGGIVIEFSGTASQVQGAFHTAIHKYTVNAEQHYANSTDPQIPAALVPVVAGVRSLNNFPARPMNHPAGVFRRDKDSGKILPVGPLPIPQFNGGTGCGILGGPCEFLGPFDLATIYNFAPLWNATTPIDGTGQTIAIVGDSDINPADWVAFWNMFGVTTPKGTLNIIHDGPDPGIQGDESEADIDTQWSSAVAKGATIDFVVSESTETTFGVDLSAEYIVDNNLAPVMSESFGLCELFIGTAGNAFYNALWQQASAQGITVLISSGDQGSAGCDRGAEDATFGLAVSGFESTPFNVSVGGTDFNDLTTSANFWNSTNNPNQANAKGYIPEMTWNDTCTNSEIFPFTQTTTAEQTCNNAQVQQEGFLGVAGGSGGASNCTSSNGSTQTSCTGGYAKPSWQAGPGVPSDGKRDVPDVSLFASNGFNGTGYIVCESDQIQGSCSLTNGQFLGFGGTSVSSPAFAGIMALINQKTGERQGNANFVFYKMAAAAGNSCDSATVPSTGPNNCVFYDIPTGSTIAMACAKGSPNCTTSSSGDQIGVLSGFSTGTGYDQATGLGSVNVDNLVNQWSTFAGQFKATKFSAFTLGPPITITHGQAIPVAATVVPQTGTGTPTGSVVLIANTASGPTSPSDQQAAQQILTLANGSLPAAATTIFLPGGTSYTVTARYEGDSTFAPSNSSPVTVTVNPEASKTQSEIITFNPATGAVTSSNATSIPFGSFYILRANVTNSSAGLCAPNGNQVYGCPTGTVTLADTYNGATNPLDGGAFALNAEGYTEDQAIFLLGGQHSVAASYGGDKSYNASAASPDVVTVTKAPTTISLMTPGFPTVGIGLGNVFTATISTTVFLPSLAPTADYPADNVQFFRGSTPLTGQVSFIPSTGPSGTAQVIANFSTASLPAGNNTITAQFLGDSNYSASSVSNSVTLDVVIPTTTTLTSSNLTIQHGAPVTLTAQVTPSQAGPALTGTVQFTLNCATCTSIGSAPIVNGQAQLTTSAIPSGVQTIIAAYSGDVDYGNSSAGITETVNSLATTTTVTTSNPAIQQGASVTLTAHVAPNAAGGPVLSGTVQFSSEPTAQGAVTALGAPVAVTSGQAQLTTTSIPAGTQLVLASYSGDTNYAISTATTAEVVTAAPTFTVDSNNTSVVINSPGGSGSAVVTFNKINAFTGTIPLSPSVCSGMPSETTCSWSASSVVLSSTVSSAMATVTFQTTAPSKSLALPQSSNRPAAFGKRTLAGSFMLACILCIGVLFACFAPRQRRWSTILALLAIASALAMGSCGGGSNGGGGGGGGAGNAGTPVGNSNVLLTFSGAGVTPPPTITITLGVQ
jgi:Pro-kumamolisin, activation domain/Bacterial Ig-like domain (group 3)